MKYLTQKIMDINFPLPNGSKVMMEETLAISFEDYMELKKIMNDFMIFGSSCGCRVDNCSYVIVGLALYLKKNENKWGFSYETYSNEQYNLLKKLYKTYKSHPQEHHK
jgi:hypothetical protein